MSAQPWFKFFPGDWRADSALRMCSPAARCLWIEMLCLMAEADPCGYLLVKGRPVSDRVLAVQAGMDAAEVIQAIAELEENGVLSRRPDGTIISRKMVRDSRKSAEQRARAEKRWAKENIEETKTGDAEADPGIMPQIPEARSQTPEIEDSSPNGDSPKVVVPFTQPKKRGTKQCPTNWQPSETTISVACDLGFTDATLDDELAAMRDYEFPRAYTDWDGVARNWLRRSAKRGPNGRTAKSTDRIEQRSAAIFGPMAAGAQEALNRRRGRWSLMPTDSD